MLERLRGLLDRPLEPETARAALAFAAAVLLGCAIVIVLASSDRRATSNHHPHRPRAARHPRRAETAVPLPQDPQGHPASAAAHRSHRELRDHAALQHVPYRRGRFSVLLVGARGGRAVLRVSAPTIGLARSGWRRFLRRFSDPGSSYIPTFRATGIVGGGGGGDTQR